MSSIRTHSAGGDYEREGGSSQCSRYLRALFAEAPSDSFIELRLRTAFGMRSVHLAADGIRAAAGVVAQHSSLTDVYVGVLPRLQRGGKRDDLVPTGMVVWADCDTASSVAKLRSAVPQPSVTVASGTRGNLHAYWLLEEPVSIDLIEVANRRLAQLLGADAASVDPARILRPPSVNHKHLRPRPVRLIAWVPSRRYRVDEIVDISVASLQRERRPAVARRARHDPLLGIEPARFVEVLAGLAVSRDRKVRCPFHDDRTASLHVYREPDRGWFCFGCGRGGSVYDFAALLWGRETRGADFAGLRQELRSIFLAQ